MTSYNLRKIIVWLQLVLQNANIFVFRPFTFITPKTAKNNVSIDCYLSLATNPLFRATKQITRDGDWRGMWDKAALCWRDNNNVSWWMCRRRVSSEVIYVFLLCSGVVVLLLARHLIEAAWRGTAAGPHLRHGDLFYVVQHNSVTTYSVTHYCCT